MKYKQLPVDTFSKEVVIAQILLLIVLGCILLFTQWSFQQTSQSTAYLELQINGQRRAFEGRVGEDMTMLDALYSSSKAGNIEFQYTPQPQVKANILQLSGLTGSDYEVYLNSVKIPLDRLDATKISANDSIIVKTIKTAN